jgi:hypothetical protein
MSHPVIRRLSTAPLNRSDGVAIELHEPGDSPATILIQWPSKPSVIQPLPLALSDVSRRLVRAFGEAQTELAKIIRDRK